MFFIIIWTALMILWFMISPTLGVGGWATVTVLLVMLLIRETVKSRLESGGKFTRKPMIYTKGKVQSKVEWAPATDQNQNSYHANILLVSKKAVMLELSKAQYDAIRENSIVNLIYQGHICAYIKGPADHSPIINTTHYPTRGKAFAKLMAFEARKAKGSSQ